MSELSPNPGLISLIRSDYERYSGIRRQIRGPEDSHDFLGRLKGPVKFITVPQLRALVLIRVTCATPHWLHWLPRSVLIYLHSIDLSHGAEIGPGLRIPHPWGICIGKSARIGSNVGLAQNVTLGAAMRAEGNPTVEDDALIMAGAMVSGPIRIGRGALVGANSVVTRDIPDGAVCGTAKLRIVPGRGLQWAGP